jgi:hypothetical protein
LKPPPVRAVQLVDEDDRGRVLARLLEELADPRGAEAGEHLDEGGRALGVELRAGLVRDGLGEQGLAGPGRTVEQHPLRDARPEALEALRVAEKVDDLLELGLRLLDARDVVPGDRRAGRRLDRLRLHLRHVLERPEEQEDDQAEKDQGQPRQCVLTKDVQPFPHVRHPTSYRQVVTMPEAPRR